MINRKPGWYRICIELAGSWMLARWMPEMEWRIGPNQGNFHDFEIYKIDERMVMTLSGELVYHRNEHDPLYNTKQEG